MAPFFRRITRGASCAEAPMSVSFRIHELSEDIDRTLMSDTKHPSLFHRVFFSHLVIVLLCFVLALVLIDYLFVGGIHHYLLHTPLILIPVMLGMIGIAGLLALWTAGSVSFPLAHVQEALGDPHPDMALKKLQPKAGTEEIAHLIDALMRRLKKGQSTHPLRPFVFRLDHYFNILDTDVDTAARLGHTPESLCRLNLRALLPDGADAASLQHMRSLLPSDGNPDPLPCRFLAAAGRMRTLHCRLHPLPDRQLLLIATPA